MLPRQLRVGDLVDDYCPRERRLTDHAIVAMVEDDVRQVRCTACDAEHEYRKGKVPVSRKKKPAPPLPPPGSAAVPASPPIDEGEPAETIPAEPAVAAAPDKAPAQMSAEPTVTDETANPPEPGQDGPFHRRLIRAQLPRIEGAEPAPRPIPEFTMHKPASAYPGRHGRPFRPGQPGGGQHRPGGKGPGGPRHGGGTRHGQGQGHADGNTFGNRGGRGGHGGPGGPGGPRPSRHGFGPKPSRGPKKH
jgi:translation initiation factor IF-2